MGAMSLALNDSHDLHLGAQAGVAIATGGNLVAQTLLTRLRLFLGEWFLNVNAGTPWHRDVLVAGSDVRIIESALKRQILAVRGVERITAFVLSFDRAVREVTVTFEVYTIFGPSEVIEVTV